MGFNKGPAPEWRDHRDSVEIPCALDLPKRFEPQPPVAAHSTELHRRDRAVGDKYRIVRLQLSKQQLVIPGNTKLFVEIAMDRKQGPVVKHPLVRQCHELKKLLPIPSFSERPYDRTIRFDEMDTPVYHPCIRPTTL